MYACMYVCMSMCAISVYQRSIYGSNPSISQQLALPHQMSAPSSAEKSALPSHSVAKPVDSSLLAEVRKLGHYPKRYKRPADDAQKSENSLAKRLCKAWLSLPEGERQQLEEMKAHSAAKSVGTSLVDMVRQLGHYPKRFHRPANDQERAENVLADRVSKAWQSLPEGEREHLQEMKANRGKRGNAKP